ncbi:hypothetical protein ACQUQQ_08400 [Acidithiobacillus ferrooxidans]|uniref:hypothetical protein n=1 Tax=Acidithiobacillus ferrooxidans TaxID=920 RepID=UPI000B2B053E
MFYFHDPLMDVPPQPITPPAITRVVEAPAPPPAPPPGWRWGKRTTGVPVAGKEGSSRPTGIVAPCPELRGVTAMPASPAIAQAMRDAQEARTREVPQAELPTWSIVSWRNLAPRSITGTREEAVSLTLARMAAAGVHHLDVKVYAAIHVIVAMKR